MDMSSGYYIVFLVAIVASVAAIQQQQLGIAFIAFLVAIVVFWLGKRQRKVTIESLEPRMLSQDRNPESAVRRNRVLIRIWLPLAVVWILGAWMLGVRDNWLLMGPPGLMFVVLGWWAHDPKKPFMAIAMGVVFAVLGYLLFAR